MQVICTHDQHHRKQVIRLHQEIAHTDDGSRDTVIAMEAAVEHSRTSSFSSANSEHRLGANLGRRELLCGLTLAAAVVGGAPVATAATSSRTTNIAKSRQSRYQADSAEVQTFYRVNRYPKK